MSRYKFCRTFTHEGKRVYCYGNTPEEAERRRKKKQKELKNADLKRQNMTVSEWAEIAVETYKTNQKDVTRQRYEARLRKCILSIIGSRKLKSLRPVDLQNVLNKQAGRSKTQVNEVYYQLKFIFRTARLNGIIQSDPSESLIRPAAHKKEVRRALAPAERAYIRRISLSNRKYYIFALMLFCGLRPSEACECMGKDIDGRQLHVRGTKTAFSERFVPIPDKLYEVIKNTPENEYIGLTEEWHKIDARKRSKLWSAMLNEVKKYMGFRPDLVPYCLRHDYCTQLARRGIDIRIAQKLMGHANISMTANIYTNLSREDTAIAELHDL